jgi:hypothetical protein
MIGFRMTMYAIVTKVTRPPRTSAATVDPRPVISKNRSKPFFGSVGSVGSVVDAGAVLIGDLRGRL